MYGHENRLADTLPVGAFRRFLAWFDPGWLYLAAGLGLVISTVLIPAFDDLAEARWQRDRALAIERHRATRLDHYETYLAALDRADPALVESLAMTQLGLPPPGRSVIDVRAERTADGQLPSASVFRALEPPPLTLPKRARVGSRLEAWTTNDHTRVWLLIGGGACILFGLLPPVSRRRGEQP